MFFRANSLPEAFYILQHSVTGLKQVLTFSPEPVAQVLFIGNNFTLFLIYQTGIVFLEVVHLLERRTTITAFLRQKPVYSYAPAPAG